MKPFPTSFARLARTPFSFLSLLIIISSLLSSPSTAQIALLPDCADQCYLSALSGSFGCADTDIQCFCTPPGSTKYLSCVESACDSAGVSQFEAYGKQNCGAYGFTAGAGAATTGVFAGVVATSDPLYQTGVGGGQVTSYAYSSIDGLVLSSPVVFRTQGVGTSLAGAVTVTSVVRSSAAATGVGGVTGTGSAAGGMTTEIVVEQQQASGGGLSTGAKAGIGAGVGVGAAVVLVLLGLLVWKLRQRKRRNAGGTGVGGIGESGGAGSAVGTGAGVSYVPSSNGGEGGEWTKIESQTQMAEVHGSSGIAVGGEQGAGSELGSHDGHGQGGGGGSTML